MHNKNAQVYIVCRCGHCQSLKPAWIDLAKNLEGRVRVGAVDCTANKQTCSEFGVNGEGAGAGAGPGALGTLGAPPPAPRLLPAAGCWAPGRRRRVRCERRLRPRRKAPVCCLLALCLGLPCACLCAGTA